MVFLMEIFPVAFIFSLTVLAMLYILFYGVSEHIVSFIGQPPSLIQFNLDYVLLFFLSLCLLFFWLLGLMIFTRYYLDCWVVTSERTIHTELRGLFSRFYSSVSHDRVQDVTVDVCGVLPTVLKYGNLKIQTAGAFKKFIFRQIPAPYETKRTLLQAIKDFKLKNRSYQEPTPVTSDPEEVREG